MGRFCRIASQTLAFAACAAAFFSCRRQDAGYAESNDTASSAEAGADPFSVEAVLPASCDGQIAGFGYRLLELADGALDRMVAETPEMLDYGVGIRDLEYRRRQYYEAAWQRATNALETTALTPEERVSGLAAVEWHQGRLPVMESHHADAETPWDHYWQDFEANHWLRHALHCIFPPADKLPEWKRVRNASGFFSGDIPFSFTNGFASLSFARDEIRKEWDCNETEPYAIIFRIEPDWCLAETADADLFVYEEDIEKLVCLHDWKKLHIAVVRSGRVAVDFVFSKGGIFVEGFSLHDDGSLAMPEDVREKLAEAGFSNDIRLPPGVMK